MRACLLVGEANDWAMVSRVGVLARDGVCASSICVGARICVGVEGNKEGAEALDSWCVYSEDMVCAVPGAVD